MIRIIFNGSFIMFVLLTIFVLRQNRTIFVLRFVEIAFVQFQ